MRKLGVILIILGLAGSIVFGIQAFNDSETFSFLGLDVGVSNANWTPVIVSGVITFLGIIMMTLKPRK